MNLCNHRNWGTGLKRGDKMICLRRYGSRKEAEAHLSGDHADAEKLDAWTWFDTPMTYRFKPGAKVVAVLETTKAKRALERLSESGR